MVMEGSDEGNGEGSRRRGSIPAKPRFRSVPDVTDTKFAEPASCGFAY